MPDTGRDPELDDRGTGGRLVAADGRTLPLRGVSLYADASGGLARVVLAQRFVNHHAEPLRATYLVPLPVDGALAGYTIRVGDRRIIGDIERVRAARERFETALLEGRTAGLVDQERPNIFTLELGNVPPGAEVVAELTVDQRLAWMGQGGWEWRFPTVVAPRYLGADGRVADAERITVEVADAPIAVRADVTLFVRDAVADGRAPVSPSHTIDAAHEESGCRVRIEAAALDRDVVVRWRTAGPTASAALDAARPPQGHPRAGAAYGLLTVVPPVPEAEAPVVPRDLILLLDTSGSMDGLPLDQARIVARALVQGLGEADRLEMIAFATAPRRWRRGAAAVTEAVRHEALAWLDGLTAGGGTEMREGIIEALRPLRPDAQRQVVMVTDGQIGFEHEIVAAVAGGLPSSSRLHVVGVGSAVNRALTAPAARAGRGVEIVLGLDEAVAPAVNRLLAATRAPLLTDIMLWGPALRAHVPAALPDVHAGAPLRAAVELSPDGGELIVRGRTPAGAWEQRLTAPALELGTGNPAVIALYGREAVEDLTVRRAVTDHADATVDAEIERLGLEFRIATPRTSWVAIAEEPSVDPTKPTRRARIPHALPHGMSIEGLGLRRGQSLEGPLGSHSTLLLRMGLLEARLSLGGPADRVAERGLQDAPGPRFFVPQSALKARSMRAGVLATFTARLVLRKGRQLTFEIVTPLDMDWEPVGVVVVWPDHSVMRAEIVEAHTTARGRIPAGVTLRLCVVLAGEGTPATPEEIGVFLPGGLTRIRVRA